MNFDINNSLNIFWRTRDGFNQTRRLIFNLATSGHLTANVSDKAEISNRSQSSEEVALQPRMIPGWRVLDLATCAEIYNGNSTSSIEKATMESNEDGLNYIATKDVGYGFQTINYQTGLRIGNSEKNFKIAPKNSILICLEGGSAGRKMGIVEQDIAFGNKLFAIVCKPLIHPEYLMMYFLSSQFQNDFRAQLSGIIGGISKAKFSSIQIPVPSIDEQAIIVSKAKSLIGICDELEESTKRANYLAMLSRKSTVDALSSAQNDDEIRVAWQRIHANWEVVADSSESLESIKTLILDLAVRGDLVRMTYKQEFVPIEWSSSELKLDDSKLWHSPNTPIRKRSNWNQVPLAKLGSWGSGGTPTSSRKDYYLHGTIPWAVIGDLNNELMLTTEALITEKALQESSSKLIPKGSILIAMYGASIGKVAMTGIECCTNQAIAHCVVDTNIVSKEYFFILAKSLKRYLIQEGKGAAQPNISQSVLKHLIVDLPPLSEQEQIVKTVNELTNLIDQFRLSLHHSEVLAESFSRAVVSAAV